MTSVTSTLLDLVHKKTGTRPQPDDTFAAIQIDSLAMAELTVEIEKTFNIRIGEDVMDCTNLTDLAAYIERKSTAQ